MRGTNQIVRIMLVALLFLPLLLFSGCEKSTPKTPAKSSGTVPPYTSFRDIPGVTAEEIAAIEKLQKQDASFVVGMAAGAEAFLRDDGKIGGYALPLSDWLSDLFGLKFHPALHPWDDLLDKLDAHEIDFVGNLRVAERRRGIYVMTDPVARRALKAMRIEGSLTLGSIAQSRPPRFAFHAKGGAADSVAAVVEPGSYETVFVPDFAAAYQMLINGEADAFIGEGVAEAVFADFGNILIEDFFPLIFSPISLATTNQELKPVISIVTKALQDKNTYNYLQQIYKTGDDEYKRHRFIMQLTDEEKAYLRENPVVPFVSIYYNYPITFYNTYEGKWEGFGFDLLREVEKLTGLTFTMINDPSMEFPEVLQVLADGKAYLTPSLVQTKGREGRYIWSDTKFMQDQYVLLSKWSYPNVEISDINNARVGLVKATSWTEMFRKWFPNATNATEYINTDAAFAALNKGEVDLVMTTLSRLMTLTNYYEFTDYKANIFFDGTFGTAFGFNKDQFILRSILDKAFVLIDTDRVVGQWTTKTHDYQSKLTQAQRPWLIGAIGLSLVILALILVLLLKHRRTGKQLEKLVVKRTRELELRTIQLIAAEEQAREASAAKSRFIANMSHEMRTPMNVIVGFTDLLLDSKVSAETKETLKKINTAGNTLMGIINDVLDLSKVEAGKLDLTSTQYDTANLLNDIVALNTIRIGDKPIAFRLDISEDLPCSLYGDELRIKQIINNILGNAFKYTQIYTKGKRHAGVEVRAGRRRLRMDVHLCERHRNRHPRGRPEQALFRLQSSGYPREPQD